MIEILEYKYIGKGALKAQMAICVPKWGRLIIQPILEFENGAKHWISLPSHSFKDKAGKTQYSPHMKFEDSGMMDVFQKRVFEALAKWNTDHKPVFGEPTNGESTQTA